VKTYVIYIWNSDGLAQQQHTFTQNVASDIVRTERKKISVINNIIIVCVAYYSHN